MSEFWFVFFFVVFLLIPPALIVSGILLKREKYGLYLFLAGWIWISIFLIPYISEILASIICVFLNSLGITAHFRDTSIIDVPLVIISIWAGTKTFAFISKPRKAKAFVSKSRVKNPSADVSVNQGATHCTDRASNTATCVPNTKRSNPMKRFWLRMFVCFSTLIVCVSLTSIFVDSGMAGAVILLVVIVAFFLPWAYKIIDKKLASGKRGQIVNHIQEKETNGNAAEAHCPAPSPNDSILHVQFDTPRSQRSVHESSELTETEKKLRDAILHDLYGKRHSSYEGSESHD